MQDQSSHSPLFLSRSAVPTPIPSALPRPPPVASSTSGFLDFSRRTTGNVGFCLALSVSLGRPQFSSTRLIVFLKFPSKANCVRFCLFFSHLCSKTVDVLRLDEIQMHLVREVRLCGPVYFRWMYPFERYMKILKGYVRNTYRPEGCMVECYIAEEAIEVCSEYLSGVDPIGIPLKIRSHHKDVGYPLSAGKFLKADKKHWQQAHHYVLDNTPEVEPYIKEHKKSLIKEHPKKSKNLKWLQDEHNRTFIYWLQKKVEDELNVPNNDISETLRWIAHGPRYEVTKYSGYSVNGCNFHTKSRDDSQVTQNSGVSLVANTMQISSAKDKNPIISDMTFYGVIQEIWELNYNAFMRVVFKCDWVENKSGIRLEEFGIKLIDLNKIGHKLDSFVLATQVKQIFYIADPGMKNIVELALKMFKAQKGIKGRKNINWKVVQCPLQEGTVECGYYVMKYMKEIVDDPNCSIITKFKEKATYTQQEIDALRIEWAEYVDDFIPIDETLD